MQGHQISQYLKEIRHMLITLSNDHLNETARSMARTFKVSESYIHK